MMRLTRVHAIVATFVVISSLTACVRDESTEQESAQQETTTGTSALDEIRQQLERPLTQPEVLETAAPTPTKGRWKAYPNAAQKQEPQVDQQKRLLNEIFQEQRDASWPPRLGSPFPTISFLTPHLEKRSIESFRGRVVLVEYASMTSPVTQAFSGSNERGPYGATPLTRRFKALEKYFPDYAGGINANEIVILQILMSDTRTRVVSPAAAAAWVDFYELEVKRNRVVVLASAALLRNGGGELRGGFQLLDKNLIIRADATRDRSKTLFSELFPLIPRLVRN